MPPPLPDSLALGFTSYSVGCKIGYGLGSRLHLGPGAILMGILTGFLFFPLGLITPGILTMEPLFPSIVPGFSEAFAMAYVATYTAAAIGSQIGLALANPLMAGLLAALFATVAFVPSITTGTLADQSIIGLPYPVFCELPYPPFGV